MSKSSQSNTIANKLALKKKRAMQRAASEKEATKRHNDLLKTLSTHNKFNKDPIKNLQFIVIEGGEIKQEPWITIRNLFNFPCPLKEELLNFLSIIAKKSPKMLQEKKFLFGFKEIVKYQADNKFIRKIEDWNYKSHNIHKQFSEILRHIFAQYETPYFLDKTWFTEENRNLYETAYARRLFIHLAQGNSLKTFEEFPVNFTKKMRHHFMKAPADYHISEAIRYAQVIGLGGDERLVKGILTSQLAHRWISKQYDEFWITVIHFFVNNPMIDLNQIAPIVDYIEHRKNQEILTGIPFSMKGRSVNALITETEKWHDQLNKSKKNTNLTWDKWNIKDFLGESGKDENKKTYYITQLGTAKEVKEEGREMGHCVASYVHSCAAGKCSIWSLNMKNYVGVPTRLVTIELNSGLSISQIRGKYNRPPTANELNIISKWATENNLTISRWITR